MIERKRLEELIEQNAIVYYVANNEICQLELTYKHNIYLTVEGYYICLYGNNGLQIYGDKLFESKAEAEEAEWYKEFSDIERTERLELPTWEEFLKTSNFIFESKDRTEMDMAIWFNSQNDDIKTIRITNLNDWNICYFELPLTQENYTLACRKAKELFLEGKDE